MSKYRYLLSELQDCSRMFIITIVIFVIHINEVLKLLFYYHNILSLLLVVILLFIVIYYYYHHHYHVYQHTAI